MLHPFSLPTRHIDLPHKFTYPFHYTPHPLCVMAAQEVQTLLSTHPQWQPTSGQGKMFGVLVVHHHQQQLGYLAAFSGTGGGPDTHPFFVPPIYDTLHPDGFFRAEEQQISAINAHIEALQTDPQYILLTHSLRQEQEAGRQAIETSKAQLKAAKALREQQRLHHPDPNQCLDLIHQSQHQKAEHKRLEQRWRERIAPLTRNVEQQEAYIEQLKQERRQRSAALQQKLFEQFHLLNALGQEKSLRSLFQQTPHQIPPAGAGECAAPKLLQYAYTHQLTPLAMAEFWWGPSPKAEVRHHGQYYPACKEKCEPILQHMLQGLEIEENPLCRDHAPQAAIEVIFEDEWLAVVHKPAGMLSVPGKQNLPSVYTHLRELYPDATGPVMVHRLDMATSGLLLIAKTKEIHQELQAQFLHRTIRKRYIALLDGLIQTDKGLIDLPLCPDPSNRPQQIVSPTHGKKATTQYEVLQRTQGHTRVAFYPLTGRTHQLRLHAAHPLGLHCPIVGDELYGRKSDRLYLHAESIEFRHPISGATLRIEHQSPF